MPASQVSGGGKVIAVAVAAVALGAVVGVACVVARGSGAPAEPHRAVHKDLAAHHAEGQRSRLVITTSPQPTEPSPSRPERPEQEEDRREEELPSRNNRTNETRGGRKRANETRQSHRNGTNETGSEHEHEHEHEHDHKRCAGGPAAACECMLKCEVFGGNVSRCAGHSHNETKALVDGLILKTMLSHRSMCDGMKCIRDCAEALGCLDSKVVEDCHIIKRSYAESKRESDPDCHLHCSS